MSRVAEVLSAERTVEDDGTHGLDVKCDPGGGCITAPHFADAGDDSPPLRGDYVALEDSSGSGCEHANGYADVRNPGKAEPGEKRIYARDASGAVVGDIWLKGSGEIVATNAGGSVRLARNGELHVSGPLYAADIVHVAGSADAAALASVVDAILSAIAAAVPAPPSGPDAGEPGLLAIQSALAAYVTSASQKLKVGG